MAVNWRKTHMKKPSNDTAPFQMVFSELYQHSELTLMDAYIYSFLFVKSCYYKSIHKPFCPSVHYISIECKISESSVLRSLKFLKKLGLVTVVRKGNNITGHVS